jgi:hypothetical protein
VHVDRRGHELRGGRTPIAGRDIEALVKEWATARMPPNWRDLLPPEVADQI